MTYDDYKVTFPEEQCSLCNATLGYGPPECPVCEEEKDRRKQEAYKNDK